MSDTDLGSAGAATGSECRPTSASAADTTSAFFIDSFVFQTESAGNEYQ